jgi:PTS system mannose-specific IIB component
MKNVVFTRIDDRLLHGQVIVSWVPFLKVNEIVIVDDEYARDEFMASLIKDAAPENLIVNVLSTRDAEKFLNSADSGNRVLVISRYVEYIESLVDLGVTIENLNIGGLGFKEGRKKYINAIYMSEKELSILDKISKKGIKVQVQMLPKDKAEDIRP